MIRLQEELAALLRSQGLSDEGTKATLVARYVENVLGEALPKPKSHTARETGKSSLPTAAKPVKGSKRQQPKQVQRRSGSKPREEGNATRKSAQPGKLEQASVGNAPDELPELQQMTKVCMTCAFGEYFVITYS